MVQLDGVIEMEKYLKMSDFIVGDVSMSMNHNGDVSVHYDYADPDMIVRKTMDAMEHAINSHDELVAMNKELLAALECLLDDMRFRAKMRGDVEEDGCVILDCGSGVLIKVDSAIAKAKSA